MLVARTAPSSSLLKRKRKRRVRLIKPKKLGTESRKISLRFSSDSIQNLLTNIPLSIPLKTGLSSFFLYSMVLISSHRSQSLRKC